MDQSASVFALRDSALLVSFKPSLTATSVSFPKTQPEFVFVVAQSFIVADKYVTGPIHYNLRVVECTLAALVLAKVFRLKRPLNADAAPLGVSLRGFHDAYYEEKNGVEDNTKVSEGDFEKQLEQLIGLTKDYLHQEDGYTREDISAILGISVDELNEKYTKKFPVRAEKFKLRQRALHVFSEALRVQKFMAVLNDESADEKQLPKQLGELMNETQDSCRDVYECSCPEIDELCDIARGAGAFGSRLTGAGWGGCTVHLVGVDKVDAVTKAWEERYYRKKFPDITKEKLEEAIVVSRPGRGSLVWKVEGKSHV